jgi:RNA polymerase sigma-70 factor (ECF subfamily)
VHLRQFPSDENLPVADIHHNFVSDDIALQRNYSANFNFENDLDVNTSLVSAPLCWLTACIQRRPQGEKGGALNHGKSNVSARQRELVLLRAQAGDPEALNVLFESCRGRLYGQALRILARPQDAEDAVQEAMLAAFTHLRRFQRRADFLTWVTRIVINAALQHIRKTRTKPTVAWDQIDSEGASFSEYLRDPQPSPEQQLQKLEQRELLEDALQKLPVEMRRAIELSKSTDSLKKAASALGLPVSTVKARLHRGRRALMESVKRETQVRLQPHNERSSELCGRACDLFREELAGAW